jgi:hypothetical protein
MVADVNESVRDEHARLRDAATQGALGQLCRQHDLDLLVVFGSVLDPGSDPRDLDVAVRFGPRGAIMERFDTDRFRAMELELMTGEPPASSTPSGP